MKDNRFLEAQTTCKDCADVIYYLGYQGMKTAEQAKAEALKYHKCKVRVG